MKPDDEGRPAAAASLTARPSTNPRQALTEDEVEISAEDRGFFILANVRHRDVADNEKTRDGDDADNEGEDDLTDFGDESSDAESDDEWAVFAANDPLCGRRIEIKWANGRWLSALVTDFDPVRHKHCVVFDDGDVQWYALNELVVKCEGAPTPPPQMSEACEQPLSRQVPTDSIDSVMSSLASVSSSASSALYVDTSDNAQLSEKLNALAVSQQQSPPGSPWHKVKSSPHNPSEVDDEDGFTLIARPVV